MKHQKVMNDFRIYMGNRNRTFFGWIVIWLTAIALFLTTAEKYDQPADGRVWQAYIFGAGMLLLMAMMEYVKKYTCFYGMEPASEGTVFVGVPVLEDLTDIAKCLSFDAGTYCVLLGKAFLPMQIISAASVIAIGMILHVQTLQIALFAGMIALLPWTWLLVKKMQLQHVMTHADFPGSKLLLGLLNGIWMLARILLVGFSFVHFALLAIGFFGTSKLLAGIDGQEAVRFSMDGGFWLIVAVISCIGISILFTDTDREMVIAILEKARAGILVALVGIMVLSIGMYCRNITTGKLVRLTKDEIMVRKAGNETCYKLEDITDYRIFCQNSAIQMELSFYDGNKETIFKSGSEETEGWNKAYYSDYNYVAYLVDRLTKLGVNGTLEDEDRLERIVSTYDQECVDGFRYFSEILRAQ